ncbi:hypothetical protein TrRE_jg1290, partial [Triparma retinervis]
LITSTSPRFTGLQKSLMYHLMSLPGDSAALAVSAALVNSVRSRQWWGWSDRTFLSSLRSNFSSRAKWIAGNRADARYLTVAIGALCGTSLPPHLKARMESEPAIRAGSTPSTFPPEVDISSLDDPYFAGVSADPFTKSSLRTWSDLASLSRPRAAAPAWAPGSVPGDVLTRAMGYLRVEE